MVASVLAARRAMQIENRIESVGRRARHEPVNATEAVLTRHSALGYEIAPVHRQTDHVHSKRTDVGKVAIGPPGVPIDLIELVRFFRSESANEILIGLRLGRGDLVRTHPVLSHEPTARVDAFQDDRPAILGAVVEFRTEGRHVTLGGLNRGTTGEQGAEQKWVYDFHAPILTEEHKRQQYSKE